MSNRDKIEKGIQRYCLQSCRHTTENYDYGGHAYTCNHICEQINIFLTENDKISDDTLECIFDFLKKGKFRDNNYYSYYYQHQKCLLRNYEWVGVLERICSTHSVNKFIDDKIVDTIMNDSKYGLVLKYMVDQGCNISLDSIETILEKLEHPIEKCDDKYQYMIDVVVAHITPELLEDCFKVRCKYFHKLLSINLEKIDYEFDVSHLIILCKYMPYSYDTIKTVVSKGVELDDGCFDVICRYCDYESMKLISGLGKFIPKNKHFRSLITSVKYEGPSQSSRRYYYRHNNPINKDGYNTTFGSGYLQEKMELLIKLGYKPTYTDIVDAIKTKCEIPGIERFDINTDSKLLDKCQKHNFFPKYNFNCITNEMMELRGLCSQKGIGKIRSCIKNNDLVPDEACLENASKIKTNLQTVNFLIEKGGKVNFKCVENSADTMSANSTLMVLVDAFKKNYKAEKGNYEKRIKELEKKVTLLELKKDVNAQEYQEDQVDYLQLAVEKMDKKMNSYIDKDDVIEIEIDGLDDESDELDNELDNESDKPDELDKSKNEIKIVAIPDERIKSIKGIPKQRRMDVKIPTKYAELFKLDKDTKISYISVKKDLIERINKNNWYNKSNKQLVNLPDDVNSKLGLDKGCVKFEDIDKLVSLFYS
jgi:FtsZ-binding cell division protein ZapB